MRGEPELLIEEARKWIGVREIGGENRGPEVERFQKAVDGKAQGEPWCMAFVQFCLMEITRGPIEIPVSEHCLTVWNRTPIRQRLFRPVPGSIMIWRFGDTTAGHVGIVTRSEDDYVWTVEGNTGPGAGVVREGDGVYERVRLRQGSDAMRVVGWVWPWRP